MYLSKICIIFILLPVSLFGAANPDISAIGDFRLFTGNYQDTEGIDTDRNGNANFQINSLELALNGNLNPYTRGDFYIANHGEGFEIEEGYITFLRGLPLKLQIRAGKYLVDFGRLNRVHPHAYSFLDRPIFHRILFGYDGLNDVGLNINFLLPTSFYSSLSLNLLAGKSMETHMHAHEHEAEEDVEHGRNSEDPIYSGRLNCFFPIGENGNLDVGFSGLYGLREKHEEDDDIEKLYSTLTAVDLKYKHRWSDYRSFELQGEVIVNKQDFLEETTAGQTLVERSSTGAWGAVDLRFKKQYNVGFKYEYAPGIFDYQEEVDYGFVPDEDINNTSTAKFDEKNSTTALTLFGGYMLMEETTLIRLAATMVAFDIQDTGYLANSSVLDKESEFTISLQVVWSLGPHKPHNF